MEIIIVCLFVLAGILGAGWGTAHSRNRELRSVCVSSEKHNDWLRDSYNEDLKTAAAVHEADKKAHMTTKGELKETQDLLATLMGQVIVDVAIKSGPYAGHTGLLRRRYQIMCGGLLGNYTMGTDHYTVVTDKDIELEVKPSEVRIVSLALPPKGKKS